MAVAYVRVSSKEQREEGFSIEAQERLVREYAHKNGITIVKLYIEVESASKAGRPRFNEMQVFLKQNPWCRIILVEKLDRLSRNYADIVKLEELGCDVHFVKRGQIIGPGSKAAEMLAFDVEVAVAKHTSRNLGEETKKGQLEKARSGMWPSFAPVGYKNVDGPAGKRVIVPDLESASPSAACTSCIPLEACR